MLKYFLLKFKVFLISETILFIHTENYPQTIKTTESIF